jgi:hypothetical protein
MGLKLKTGPASEPVTLQEAKDHLRVDLDDEDSVIEGFIKAARTDCENLQNRAYISQTWELWLDEWPDEDYIVLPRPPLYVPSVTAGAFVVGTVYRILTVGTTNFVSIGASASTVGVVFTATGAGSGTGTATASCVIKYYGTDDTEYSISGADYIVDDKDMYEPRINLAYSKTWPSTTLRPINGICVQFIAGYGGHDEVPKNVWQAILLLVGHYYEHREEVITGTATQMPVGVESLLMKEKVY